jgi:hypothetical protein
MDFTLPSNFEVLLTPTVKRRTGMGEKVKRESSGNQGSQRIRPVSLVEFYM